MRARGMLMLAAAMMSLGPVQALQTVAAASAAVKWTGRCVVNADNSVTADWGGVMAAVSFVNGTTLSVTIRDSSPGGSRYAVYQAGLDVAEPFRVADFFTSAAQTEYTLVSNTWPGMASGYTWILERGTEASISQAVGSSNVTIVSFTTDGVFQPAPPPSPRRIAIVGDSITAGQKSAQMGPNCNYSPFNSHFAYSWARLLCTNFTADCSATAWSGEGLVSNWNGQGQPLPYYFPWTLAFSTSHAYDFTSWVPHAYLINLGTNDCNGGRCDNATFLQQYVDTYTTFISNITSWHGVSDKQDIKFFLAVGPMSSSYMAGVQQVVAAVNGAGYNATLVDLTPAAVTWPIGCGGHPSPWGHFRMSEVAQPIIAAVMGWQ